MYNSYEVCEKLAISIYTLKNWYVWENKLLKEGAIKERYLPVPYVDLNKRGKPKCWDDEMLEELKDYRNNIVVGRNGIYGKFSNPFHKQTKKYLKELEEKNNG